MDLEGTLRSLSATALELPEDVAETVGKGFTIMGEALKELAARIDALEEKLRAS